MKNFLYIFEDGSVRLGSKPGAEEYDSAEQGMVTIINMKSKQIYDTFDGWIAIQPIDMPEEEQEIEEDEEYED
jgi:hypothetical protein